MKSLTLILALLACCGFGLAQTDQDKDKDAKSAPGQKKSGAKKMANTGNDSSKSAVMDMEHKLREAALKGDASVLQQWLADDYHSVSAVDGQAHTKDEAVSNLKDGKLKYQSIDASSEDVQVYAPALAIAHGVADVKGTMNGQDFSGKFHFARTWVKRGGKWQAIWFQTTKMP